MTTPIHLDSALDGKPLRLKFKGERNYMHGSDIYNSLTTAAPALTADASAYISGITFRRFARKDCAIVTVAPSSNDAIAEARLRVGDGREGSLWVVELDVEAAGRYEFDEASIVDPAVIDKDCIGGPASARYSPVEVAIALTKELNYHKQPKPLGRWVFGQLALTRPFPTEYSAMRVCLRASVGTRFSTNELQIDGTSVGIMRFIVGNP
jgi:hypothetical protein